MDKVVKTGDKSVSYTHSMVQTSGYRPLEGQDFDNFWLILYTSHTFMPKRTYQPKKKQRAKVHGFRARMRTKDGKATLKRRRTKGRKRLVIAARPR